jgi:flavin reductase (DIM6/NTAB) family NADH-FMN oxidoreductase RutF
VGTQTDALERPGRDDRDVTVGTRSGLGPLVPVATGSPVWERFFTVAPLVLVATKEGDGYDIAPKHLAMPIGWQNLYGFVCTPRHATYRNVRVHPQFTVSFPGADQVVQTSLAAAGRSPDGAKPSLVALPTIPATQVEGVLVEGCPLYLECELERIVDGFGESSLIVGRVVAALAREGVLRGADVDDADLLHETPLLAYLSPGRCAAIADSSAFPFPVDFCR